MGDVAFQHSYRMSSHDSVEVSLSERKRPLRYSLRHPTDPAFWDRSTDPTIGQSYRSGQLNVRNGVGV